jgi:gas vesicle protein
MESSNDHEKNVMVSVLAGVGIGVLVGAIAGLLLAPKTGAETRQSLGSALHELGEKLGDLSQQVSSRLKHSESAPAETGEGAA